MSIVFTCPQCAEQNTVGPEFAGRRGTCAFCGEAVIIPQTSGPAKWVPQPGKGAQPKSGAPWVVILVVCCVGLLVCSGVLAGLLLPAIQAAREAGRRAACTNKLHLIGLAMHNYVATYGHLPPAAGTEQNGKPPMSWRVAILPFIEQSNLYRQYDPKEAWDSAKNIGLVKQIPSEYRCPSDIESTEGETSYVMITGKNTVGGSPGSPGTQLRDISDGLSKTVMVLEVRGLKIPWTEPRDITLDELLARRRSGVRIAHVASFNVAMADGSVRNLPATIDPETLRRLAVINDGQPVRIEAF